MARQCFKCGTMRDSGNHQQIHLQTSSSKTSYFRINDWSCSIGNIIVAGTTSALMLLSIEVRPQISCSHHWRPSIVLMLLSMEARPQPSCFCNWRHNPGVDAVVIVGMLSSLHTADKLQHPEAWQILSTPSRNGYRSLDFPSFKLTIIFISIQTFMSRFVSSHLYYFKKAQPIVMSIPLSLL